MTKFYNTVGLTGEALANATIRSGTQAEVVLGYFRLMGEASPSQVWGDSFDEATPITSIRRQITNLTKDGLLVKTGEKTEGLYGLDEYIWRLV